MTEGERRAAVEREATEVSNDVYLACAGRFERLEGQGVVIGNGHHMAQEIARQAAKLLTDRAQLSGSKAPAAAEERRKGHVEVDEDGECADPECGCHGPTMSETTYRAIGAVLRSATLCALVWWLTHHPAAIGLVIMLDSLRRFEGLWHMYLAAIERQEKERGR